MTNPTRSTPMPASYSPPLPGYRYLLLYKRDGLYHVIERPAHAAASHLGLPDEAWVFGQPIGWRDNQIADAAEPTLTALGDRAHRIG